MDARGCGRERTLRTDGIVERSAGTPRLSAAAELASSRTEILPYISLEAVTRWAGQRCDLVARGEKTRKTPAVPTNCMRLYKPGLTYSGGIRVGHNV